MVLQRSIVVLGLVAACRPHAVPRGPGPEPDPGTAAAPPAPRRMVPPAREVLIGEMCPQAAAGRPSVLPVLARKLAWTADQAEVAEPLERQSARQFSVYAWDGVRAGLFTVIGTSALAGDQVAAVGSYAGDSPCALGADRAQLDAACVAAQDHCGVAVSLLGPGGGGGTVAYGDDPDPADLPVGGGCAADGALVVDIDGDGRPEAFPAERFLGDGRQPADEVEAAPRRGARCQPRFAVAQLVPAQPPHWGGLDLLAVLDIDGDGRREVLLAYHYAERRTWAIYTASGSAARLELAAEAEPWPRP